MALTALVCLTARGAATARRLALPDAELHGLAGRVDDAEVPFTQAVAHLRSLYGAGAPIVGFCAAGVLIRALAPLLADKRAEPPVVAVAEDGSAVVPLLGGHHGANALARRIAERLGVAAAVTTAGERRFGFALDEPPAGWRVGTPDLVKPVTAALLAGAPVRLVVEAGEAEWLAAGPWREEGELAVRVTDCSGGQGLLLHPPTLALGVGCERGCDPAELAALAQTALQGLAPQSVACVVSLDLKSDEPAVHALADALGVPPRFFDAATLEREKPRLRNPSEAVFREVGCHGVAEGAALAAVGGDGALIVEKRKSARATCAVARSPRLLDPTAIGRGRGRLAIVGLGPGDPAWRTREAEAELRQAEDVVGYRLYLDLAADLIQGRRHDYALGEEEARAAAALDLAAEGRRVALVSSGDPGVFAMASVAFELRDRSERADWRRIEVVVAPGVSAMQAAAARAGAPLGHDFCAISLSDLLTPWPAIERRLRAAAEVDFVIALYNPASRDRREPLLRALAILRESRAPATPVVLARSLGRPDERVETVALGALDPARVDMLTLLIVGASTTRSGPAGVYTPRGYPGKVRR